MQKVNYDELLYLAKDGNEFAYNELVTRIFIITKVIFINNVVRTWIIKLFVQQ
ncbi:MAG: hypothetical protein ACRC1D_01850 [Culicoidibacterales bacterium]